MSATEWFRPYHEAIQRRMYYRCDDGQKVVKLNNLAPSSRPCELCASHCHPPRPSGVSPHHINRHLILLDAMVMSWDDHWDLHKTEQSFILQAVSLPSSPLSGFDPSNFFLRRRFEDIICLLSFDGG